MPHALIVAHGQPSDPNPPEVTLARLPEQVMVYPFFMSNGWFVRQALPERLAGTGPVTLVSPFGLDRRLPELAVGMIRRAMAVMGLPAESPHVLLSAKSWAARALKNAAIRKAVA